MVSSKKKGKGNQQYEQSVTDEGKNVHTERANWFEKSDSIDV